MTYKDHFVVEVKCKGQILRVQDDIVRLPFGSEYSIYLKNLNSRRASVNVSIDGEDVLDGKSLVLNGNSTTELEGFLKGNNARNRFKFINKTKEIQDHRGDKIDDGILRVEFAFEKPKIRKRIIYKEYTSPFHWNYDNWFVGNSCDNNLRKGIVSNEIYCSGDVSFASGSSPMCCNSLGSVSEPLSDEGITVKGSECNQQFHYVTMGDLEQSNVIIIRLKGITETTGQLVQQPITVKTKLTCSSCGKVSKSSAKFCSNCGTFLE